MTTLARQPNSDLLVPRDDNPKEQPDLLVRVTQHVRAVCSADEYDALADRARIRFGQREWLFASVGEQFSDCAGGTNPDIRYCDALMTELAVAHPEAFGPDFDPSEAAYWDGLVLAYLYVRHHDPGALEELVLTADEQAELTRRRDNLLPISNVPGWEAELRKEATYWLVDDSPLLRDWLYALSIAARSLCTHAITRHQVLLSPSLVRRMRRVCEKDPYSPNWNWSRLSHDLADDDLLDLLLHEHLHGVLAELADALPDAWLSRLRSQVDEGVIHLLVAIARVAPDHTEFLGEVLSERTAIGAQAILSLMPQSLVVSYALRNLRSAEKDVRARYTEELFAPLLLPYSSDDELELGDFFRATGLHLTAQLEGGGHYLFLDGRLHSAQWPAERRSRGYFAERLAGVFAQAPGEAGPALRSHEEERWHDEVGWLSRPGGKPAWVLRRGGMAEFRPRPGAPFIKVHGPVELYFEDGRLHRLDGPAIAASDWPEHRCYWLSGKRVRPAGFAAAAKAATHPTEHERALE